jgi:hypothetical protein
VSASGPPGEVRRLLGLVLIVIGVLWMGASGLCTAAFALSLFAGGDGDLAEASSILLLMLIYGGGSVLVGLGVYALGRWLRPTR